MNEQKHTIKPTLISSFVPREAHISNLVYPLGTVLDDSIGCALWFAARGEGLVRAPGSAEPILYRSQARVMQY